MEFKRAEKIAEKYLNLLAPFCERIEIAGSVRRKKPECGDIEIVCIRKSSKLFDFCNEVNKLEKVKGEPTGKYTQRILPEGINLDLFMADKDNWGYILAIRIGPDGFSKYLAGTWVKQGFKGVDGNLTKNGEIIPVREERDLFWILGLEYIDPEYRMNLQEERFELR